MKTTFTIMLALVCAVACGCISRSAADGAHWRDQVSKVTIGMPRSVVDALLPPHPKSPKTTIVSGGSQSEAYWVDDHWCISVAYDYTGVPRDEKGMALARTSPQNKLLTAPVLSQKKMPIVEVKEIKTIEPTTEPYSK